MDTNLPYYRIYLLIVWQEHNNPQPELITWRFRLEDPRSGEQRVFVDAATLMNALHEIVSAPNDELPPAGSAEL